MGMEKRGCLHSSDVRHWAVSIWGLWMDEPHAFSASWLLWEAPGMHVALCAVPHTDADLGGQVTFRKTLQGDRTGSHPSPDGGIPREQHPEMAE